MIEMFDVATDIITGVSHLISAASGLAWSISRLRRKGTDRNASDLGLKRETRTSVPLARPIKEKRTLPPYVYLPCSPDDSGNDELGLDLWRTGDGRRALLIYSELDRLVDSLGEQRPWVAVPATEIDRLQRLTGCELVLVDPQLPEQDGTNRE